MEQTSLANMAPLLQHAGPQKESWTIFYNLKNYPLNPALIWQVQKSNSAWILKNSRKYTEYTHLMQLPEKPQEPLLLT